MSGSPSMVSCGDRARFCWDCWPTSTPAHRAPLIFLSASNTPATNRPGRCARSSGSFWGSVVSYSPMNLSVTLSFSISPFSGLIIPSATRVSIDFNSLRKTSISISVPEPRRQSVALLLLPLCWDWCTRHPAEQPCRGFSTHTHAIRRGEFPNTSAKCWWHCPATQPHRRRHSATFA